jgi:hypothetical protein
VDACEKREAIMQRILKKHKTNHGTSKKVCLVSMAAEIAHESKVDPFACLIAYSDDKLNFFLNKISAPIIRVLAILKTMDYTKYKGNSIPSMVLGMIYLCTNGISCGNVRILPRVPDLIHILPNDNRIHHYFGQFGVNTKCVTDMSNMITTALKDRVDILRTF